MTGDKGCDDGVHSGHGDALADAEDNSDHEQHDEGNICGERGEECGDAPDEDAGGKDGDACEAICEDTADNLGGHVPDEKGSLNLALDCWGVVVLVREGNDSDGEVDAVDVADDEGEEGVED